uniref:Uncharacterized protein n=1 Tax=Parascaris equorum TaxID=6256 RepID=A0A914RMZ0_PAREQ
MNVLDPFAVTNLFALNRRYWLSLVSASVTPQAEPRKFLSHQDWNSRYAAAEWKKQARLHEKSR